MATIDTKHIETVEKLLTGLGYDMGDHKAGEADAVLYTAMDQAFADVKKLAKLEGDDFAGSVKTLDAKIEEQKKLISGVEVLKSLGQDVDILDMIRKNKDLPDRFRQKPESLIDFVNNYDTYKASILAVEAGNPADKKPADPVVKSEQTQKPANVKLDLSVSDAETKALENVKPEDIQKLQEFLAGVYPDSGLKADGKWNDQTKAAYLDYTARVIAGTIDNPAFDKIPTHEAVENFTKQKITGFNTQLVELGKARSEADKSYQAAMDGLDEWFNSDETDAKYEAQAQAAKQQRVSILENQNALQQVTQQLVDFQTIMEPIAPVLDAAHKDLHHILTTEPEKLSLDAEIKGGEGDKKTPAVIEPDMLMIESLLASPEVAKVITDAAKAAGQSKYVFPQSSVKTPDGKLDEHEQAGLQHMLGFMAQGMGLGSEFLNENGEINYSPRLGRKITEALEQNATPAAQQVNEALKKTFPDGVKDPSDLSKTLGHQEFLAVYLNSLYYKEKIARKPVTQVPVPQMDPMTSALIGFVADWLLKAFPGSAPMLDSLARQFTGGLGLMDLVPSLRDNENVSKALGGLDKMEADQQLMESFKRSFRDAKDAGARAEMEAALIKSAEMLNDVPFGSEARRKHFPNAAKNAMAEALAHLGDAKPGDKGFEDKLDAAAIIYADTFMDNMYQLNSKMGGPTFDTNPELRVPDTLLVTLNNSGLDLGQSGAIDQTHVNRIVTAYNNQNHGAMDYAHKPLMFTDAKGQTYIAGIDQQSKLFTVAELPVQDINQAMANGASMETLKQSFPGFMLAQNNYRHFFNDAVKGKGVSFAESIPFMASDPKHVKPFSQIEATAKDAANEAQIRSDLEAAYLNQDERHRLEKNLSGAIINANAQAAHSGGRTNYTGDFNARSGAKLDPKTQELIALREGLNDDAKMQAELSNTPKFFSNHAGKLFVFSRVDPALGSVKYEKAFETNVTEEMGRYIALTTDQRMAYIQNQDLMKSHFPKLNAVASQYPNLDNAFKLGDEISQRFNLAHRPVPRNQAVPSWVMDQIPNVAAQDTLAQSVKNAPRIFVDGNSDHIRILGRGDSNAPFKGHDVKEELRHYSLLNPQQREQIWANPRQVAAHFPGISDIAAQYDAFKPETIMQAVLKDPSVQKALDLAAPDTAAELTQTHAANP